MSVTNLKKILELKASGRSDKFLKTIYPNYRKDELDVYRRCVDQGGSITNKIRNDNEGVLERVKQARDAFQAVHGFHLRRWGLELADEFNIPGKYFSASPIWLYKLKNKGEIGSRKVTEYISRSENNQQDIIDARIDDFLSRFEIMSGHFSKRLIINTDQTPFDYEITNKRTLSYIDQRDTKVLVYQKIKMTHSFTAQPMITRDGKSFGKPLLVLQEATKNGTFGSHILPRVRQLEDRYGNIQVYASKSGKLSALLVENWLREVFRPSVRATLRFIDTDTDIGSEMDTISIENYVFEEPPAEEYYRDTVCRVVPSNYEKCYKKPHTLLLADAWGGQTGALQGEDRGNGIESLEILKLTTNQS